MSTSKTYLVTGAAGFIGFHVSQRLLADGNSVMGVDNLNNYYDVQLKRDRLAQIQRHKCFHFIKLDLANRERMPALFEEEQFDGVIHLAAQAGVRYSIENPYAYVDSNLVGFFNVLEGCRQSEIKHLVYASSSSVYGANRRLPFSTADNVDHPISLYAATKKSNELMAHVYSHLYDLPTTGLRFFTVYGPWGRPDMALFLFTKAILEGRAIDVFNEGRMLRDFTYIDDIVEAIMRVVHEVPAAAPDWFEEEPSPARSGVGPYRIYNIGNNQPIALMDFIKEVEEALGQEAHKNFLPMQLGDVPSTFAEVDDLLEEIDFRPQTSLREGIGHFINWYRSYFGVVHHV